MPVKEVELTHANATHNLRCSHSIGSKSHKAYMMRCHVLKEMPNGRLKILVFGNRNWKDQEHVCRVRYVDAYRVRERPVRSDTE